MAYIIRLQLPYTGDCNISPSYVRGQNGAGECEYCGDRADALLFGDLDAARAFVARERRAHAFEER